MVDLERSGRLRTDRGGSTPQGEGDQLNRRVSSQRPGSFPRFVMSLTQWSFNTTLLFLGFLLGPAASGSIAQAQVSTAPLREEVRVGSVWDQDRMLTDVGGIAVYGDSLLLVLERIDHAIKVFDWSGEPVGQIGRYGSGPGEFRDPTTLHVRNDTIFVRNVGAASLVLLNILGEELARFTFPWITVADGTGVIRGPSGMLPDGTFLGYVTASRPQLFEDRKDYYLPTLKISPSGEVLDTLAMRRRTTGRCISATEIGRPRFRLPAETPSDIGVTSSGLGIVATAEPFPPGHEAHYRITSINHTGDTVFSRLYSFQPQRIKGDQLTALALAYSRSVRDSRRVRNEVEKAYAARPYVSPVSRLRIDSDGRFWVAREEVPGQPILWEVLTRLGEPLFRVELSAGVRLWFTSGDLLWAEERDDLGVPFIVRYRILIPD